jgi:hypothetical protein
VWFDNTIRDPDTTSSPLDRADRKSTVVWKARVVLSPARRDEPQRGDDVSREMLMPLQSEPMVTS